MDKAIWKKRIILRAMKKELDSRGARVDMKTLIHCANSELSHSFGPMAILSLRKRERNIEEIFKKRKIKNIPKKEIAGLIPCLFSRRRFDNKWGRFQLFVDGLERSIKSPRSKIGRVNGGNSFMDKKFIWTLAGPIAVSPKMIGWPKNFKSAITTREILLLKTLNTTANCSIPVMMKNNRLSLLPKRRSSPERFWTKFNVIRSDLAYAEKKSIERELRSMHVKPDVLQKILDDFRLDFDEPICLLPEDFRQSYHGIPLFLDFRIRRFCKENFVSEIRKKAFADITAGYRTILEMRPDFRMNGSLGGLSSQWIYSGSFLLPWEIEVGVKLAKGPINVHELSRVLETAVGRNISTPSVVLNWLAELYYAGRWAEVTHVHKHPSAALNVSASLLDKYQDLSYRDILGDTDPIPEAIRLRVSPGKVMKRFLVRTTQFQRSEFVGDTGLFLEVTTATLKKTTTK